jgi:hypothetical protein
LACAPPSQHADVRIELNRRPTWFDQHVAGRVLNVSPYKDDDGHPMRVLSELPNGWLRLSYADGTDFILDRAGTEIWATWPDGSSVDDMSAYLLGPVMGFVLRLRGRVCLHASGIVANGSAFVLIGPPGAGKSTLAAAFAARGHAVLSDDVIPLLEGDGSFRAVPGYPRVRLWPKSVEALATFDPSAPKLPPHWGERRLHLDITAQGYEFQTEPIALGAVYVLEERAEGSAPLQIGPLSGEEGLMALVSNSFAALLLDRDMRQQDFDVLSRLATTVPLRRVQRPDDLARLSDVCDLLVDDFLRLDPAAVASASS